MNHKTPAIEFDFNQLYKFIKSLKYLAVLSMLNMIKWLLNVKNKMIGKLYENNRKLEN